MSESTTPKCVSCGCNVAAVKMGEHTWHPIRCQPCSTRAAREIEVRSSESADFEAKRRRWDRSRLSQRHVSFLKDGAEQLIAGEVKALMRHLMGGGGLYLHGETGTWKTTRAVQIGRYMVRLAPRGPDLQYWTEADFFLEMRARYSERGSGDPVRLLSDLQTIPLLIFDDLGMTAQRTKSTDDWLLAVISHRYEARLPTVWTSNVLLRDLHGVIGARAARRVREGTHVVHCHVPQGVQS